MNPYLTDKGQYYPQWHKPVFAALVILTAMLTYVDVDFMIKGEWNTASVGLFMIAMCLWPMLRMIHRWRCHVHARQLAEAFLQVTEESIPLDKLYSRVRMPKLEQWLYRLLKHGYLKNAYVDAQMNTLVFTAPNPRVQKAEFIAMDCPSCGAPNQVMLGRVGRCAYCNSTLIPRSPQAH